MPFVYEDSFNGDEDLCRVLRALSLGPSSENGQPPSSPPVVTQGRPRPRVGVVDTDGYPLDSEHWVEYPEPADGSLVIPNTTENTSITTPQPSERTYDVSSTMGTSQVTGWDRVGHITFTDPSSRARRVLPPSLAAHNNHRAKRGRGQKYVAYVVFEGLQPGIYKTWDEAKPLVNGISGNNYKGFTTLLEAERCYVLAGALGSLMVLSRDSRSRTPAKPISDEVLKAFGEADNDFLGTEWYVVTKGRSPGVYPAWNFAATQTIGIQGSRYQKYESKQVAEGVFRRAKEEGLVTVL